MAATLLATLAFLAYAVAFHATAGAWIARTAERGGEPPDRLLPRCLDRLFWLFLAGSLAILLCFLLAGPPVPPSMGALFVYAAPLLWSWVLVLGASHLEMRARGIRGSLWRFHRFNLLSAFLLVGQRIPFFSAALAAPAFVFRGAEPLTTAGLHLLVAAGLGAAARFAVVNWVVGVRPYPDARLAVEVRAAAREAGIRLRGILLVPTEPGQSVNAVAATSSRIVYVAEGMWRGLRREEIRAVLLHEVGHLGQTWTNALRNLSVLGWPAIVAGGRAALEYGGSAPRIAAGFLLLLLLGAAGSHLGTLVATDAERRADLFAERRASPGALASALQKIYEGGHYREPLGRRRGEGAQRTRERLRSLGE